MVTGAVVVAGLTVLPGGPLPAAAQESAPEYAAWTLEGSGGAYNGTITLPGEFPAATFTSDARAPSTLVSGNTTWLPEGSPFGAVYGSSEGHQYLNLRPAADSPDAPSTTTYTFESPTPASGWGFTLGDIDADMVEVSATDADGNPVPVDALGFRSVFNYCDASPRSAGCSGVTNFHVPSWQPGTDSGILMGDGPDTTGGSGWFEPSVALSSLTFVFTQQSGFPIYQTWFAAFPPDPPDPPDPPEPPQPPPDPDEEPGRSPTAPPAIPVKGVPKLTG